MAWDFSINGILSNWSDQPDGVDNASQSIIELLKLSEKNSTIQHGLLTSVAGMIGDGMTHGGGPSLNDKNTEFAKKVAERVFDGIPEDLQRKIVRAGTDEFIKRVQDGSVNIAALVPAGGGDGKSDGFANLINADPMLAKFANDPTKQDIAADAIVQIAKELPENARHDLIASIVKNYGDKIPELMHAGATSASANDPAHALMGGVAAKVFAKLPPEQTAGILQDAVATYMQQHPADPAAPAPATLPHYAENPVDNVGPIAAAINHALEGTDPVSRRNALTKVAGYLGPMLVGGSSAASGPAGEIGLKIGEQVFANASADVKRDIVGAAAQQFVALANSDKVDVAKMIAGGGGGDSFAKLMAPGSFLGNLAANPNNAELASDAAAYIITNLKPDQRHALMESVTQMAAKKVLGGGSGDSVNSAADDFMQSVALKTFGKLNGSIQAEFAGTAVQTLARQLSQQLGLDTGSSTDGRSAGGAPPPPIVSANGQPPPPTPSADTQQGADDGSLGNLFGGGWFGDMLGGIVKVIALILAVLVGGMKALFGGMFGGDEDGQQQTAGQRFINGARDTYQGVVGGAKSAYEAVTGTGISKMEAHDVQVLEANGLSLKVASAVVGNIKWESGGCTSIMGDGCTSGGLVQLHGPRLAAILNKFHVANIGQISRDDQLAYIAQDLKTNYAGVYAEMNAAPDAAAASRAFTLGYEVPSDKYAKADQRAPDAVRVMTAMQEQNNGTDVHTVSAPLRTPTAIAAAALKQPQTIGT